MTPTAYRPFLPAILGAAVVALAGFLLLGGFPFLEPPAEYRRFASPRFFDEQIAALLAGRWDVACDSLNWEAFLVKGKCYGYFGATPALLRLPLVLACPQCPGVWAKAMLLAAGLANYLGLLLLARHALTRLVGAEAGWGRASAFAILGSLGSGLLFLATDPSVYHEALAWGSGLTLLGFAALLAYDEERRPALLAVLLVLLFLALNARVTLGLALALALGLVLVRRRRFGALSLALLLATTPLAVNHQKFGQIMPPFETQTFYRVAPERLSLIAGGSFQLANLPCGAGLVLPPAGFRLRATFPWVVPGTGIWTAGQPRAPWLDSCSGTNVEYVESVYPVALTMAPLAALSLLGLAALGRWRARLLPWLPLAAGGAAGFFVTLLYSSVVQRYQIDALPLLAVAATLGWAWLATLRPRAGIPVNAVVGGLVLLAGFVNLTAGMFSAMPPQPAYRALVTTLARAVR